VSLDPRWAYEVRYVPSLLGTQPQPYLIVTAPNGRQWSAQVAPDWDTAVDLDGLVLELVRAMHDDIRYEGLA